MTFLGKGFFAHIINEANYHVRIKYSLILTLTILITLFFSFPVFKYKINEPVQFVLNIVVEDVPKTQQGTFRPPPPKPAIPIATEEESIPEDETIETTELDFDVQPLISTGNTEGVGGSSIIPPKQILKVIPQYPEEDYKKGVTGHVKVNIFVTKQGTVDNVIIVENSTGSKKCAQAAKEAIFKCRFIPARQKNKAVDCWITQIITFDIHN